jgi:HK97 family phage major capsid protein
MTRLDKYRQDRKAVLDRMDALLAAVAADANADGRLSEAQQTEYDSLKAKSTSLGEAIAREADIDHAERTAPAVRSVAGNGTQVTDVRDRRDRDPRWGFSGPREFLMAALENSDAMTRDQVADDRLKPLAMVDDDKKAHGQLAYLLPRAFNPSFLGTAGADEQSGGSDPYGGFAVGRTLLPGQLSVGMEGDPTAGRTQQVPMATPVVDLLARTDKNHTSSVSGGFTVSRKAETAAAAASRGETEKVSLKASTLIGLAYATEEILTDSVISFLALIEAGFRDQFGFHMLHEKLFGLGGTEYIGAVNADCGIAVTRDTTTRILGTDIIAMRARCWGYGAAIWIANQDCFGELMRLGAAAYDAQAATPLAGSNALFVQSLSEDIPDRILGRPCFFSESAETLGTKGDISLVNWSQYLEGLYQPLQSAESMHVRFVNHERAFKFWLRNAGAPWWRSALTPRESATTLSPIVTLAA